MKSVFFILLIAGSQIGIVWGSPIVGADNKMNSYGTKVRYTPGVVMYFPDLALDFIARRHEAHPVYKRGFAYYDFRVTAGGESQRLSWSAGTGDIGPTEFTINHMHFSLALVRSDTLGRLADDELVLWKR